MIALMLAVSPLQQQQPRPRARPGPAPVTRSPANLAPSPNGDVQAPDPPPVTRYDTTMQVVVRVGRAVAEVRAELDRFHRLAFNGEPGEVVQSSGALRQQCQELAASSRAGNRVMCRSCARGSLQQALNNYHAFLPTLGQLGQRCSTTLQRLSAGTSDRVAANMRREVGTISGFLVDGLRQYEARLTPVRQALMGTPARGG